MNEIVWPTIDSQHLIVDSKQMLKLEKEMFSDGMPQEALMEKAGIQISRWLLKKKPLLKHGITVFIGPGHNGGDGAVVARELFLKGFYVQVWCPFQLKKALTKKMMHTAKYMHQILDFALPAYDELFDEIDLDGLVKKNGIMYVWTKKNIASRELEIKIRDQLGVEQQLVTPQEISDLEPNLKKFYHGGVFYPNARHTINPRKVLLKLFDLFLKKGGKFKKINKIFIFFNF